MKPNVNEIRYHSEHSKMKTKTLLTALAMTSLLPVIVQAQVTVSSVTTNGAVVTTNQVVSDVLNGLVVADTGNGLIRFVRFSDGRVTTLAGQISGGAAINPNATFL